MKNNNKNNNNKIKLNKKVGKEVVEVINNMFKIYDSNRFNNEVIKCNKILELVNKGKLVVKRDEYIYCYLIIGFDKIKDCDIMVDINS